MELNLNVYDQESSLKTFGKELQHVMWVEECSELQKEIDKLYRKRGNVEHLTEEIADVIICIGQMIECYGIRQEDIQEVINYKYYRELRRREAYAGDTHER